MKSLPARERESLRSLVERIMDWGEAATGFSKYRWESSRQQLIDSVKGRRISFGARVIAPQVKVNPDRRAYYDDFVVFGFKPLENAMGLAGLFPGKYIALRCTSSFEVLSYYQLNYRLWDSSDRLALDLEGRKIIEGEGWISAFELGKNEHVTPSQPRFYLEIVMTSWTERPMQPPNF